MILKKNKDICRIRMPLQTKKGFLDKMDITVFTEEFALTYCFESHR
jgi:hypothetical protein